MKSISRDELSTRLATERIKPRLRRIVRYVPEEVTRWDERDFLAVMDRSRNEGVLLFDDITIPFSLMLRTRNAHGRAAAIICDICATWRRGTESAIITFPKGKLAHVSYLVCADLDCSLHVRGLTDAGKYSRTQMREDISPESRVLRLRTKLHGIITNTQV